MASSVGHSGRGLGDATVQVLWPLLYHYPRRTRAELGAHFPASRRLPFHSPAPHAQGSHSGLCGAGGWEQSRGAILFRSGSLQPAGRSRSLSKGGSRQPAVCTAISHQLGATTDGGSASLQGERLRLVSVSFHLFK